MNTTPFDIDFDYWAMLAEHDPAAFFAERDALIAAFIAAAPMRIRADLEALQAQVDVSRVEAGTPARASSMLLAMMGERLAAMAGHMTQLRAHSRTLTGVLAGSAD